MTETNKKAILAVSYGTADPEQYERTIAKIEGTLASAFPERRLFSAWTSGFMRGRIMASCGMCVDSVDDAMKRMADYGVEDVIVQFLLVSEGEEYDRVICAVKRYAERFRRISVGRPLLSRTEDADALAEKLSAHYASIPENEMLVFMAHGTPDADSSMTAASNDSFSALGSDRFAVGTLEGKPGIEPVLRALNKRKPRLIHIAPLMISVGKHTLRDIAGEGERSLKSIIAREGVKTHCILHGLGEYAEITELFVRHAKEAETI